MPIYAIHEAYYDKNGRIWTVSVEPVYPEGDSVQELESELREQLKALAKPVLDYDSIPEPGAIGPPSDHADTCQTISWGIVTKIVEREEMVLHDE